VEWVKCRARVHRWEEEVELVLEEMRRVLCYMDWRATYWQSLTSKSQVADTAIREGISAYAKKQAHIMRTMGVQFSRQWHYILEGFSISPEWPEHYIASN
jgi:hypothetical protein